MHNLGDLKHISNLTKQSIVKIWQIVMLAKANYTTKQEVEVPKLEYEVPEEDRKEMQWQEYDEYVTNKFGESDEEDEDAKSENKDEPKIVEIMNAMIVKENIVATKPKLATDVP